MEQKKTKVKADKKKTGQSFFQRYVFELLVLTFSFGLFINSIPNGYNMDDELVTINHRLTSKGISAIPEIFTSPYYQDDMGYTYEYRPVVLASFAIEHQFFGDNPHVSHFFNVLLYSLCCLLLYRVLLNISSSFTPVFSLLVTLLFAAHPSHTEVVSSIKNRDEILGLIFCLLSFLVVVTALQKSKPFLLTLVPVLFALALMNKITFIPFSVIVILAISLFTSTRLSTLLLISLLFALPGFLLLQSSSLIFKLEVTLIIPASALAIYYLVKFLGPDQALSRRATKWKQQILDLWQNGAEQQINSADKLNGIADGFLNSLPPRSYFSVTLLNALPFFLLALYFGGLMVGSHIVCLISLIALFIISYRGKEASGWWATVALYVAIGCFTSSAYADDVYSIFSMNIIFLCIVFGFFYDTRKFFIPSIVLGLLFIVKLSFHIFNSPAPPHGIVKLITLIAAYPIFYFVAFAILFKKSKRFLVIALLTLLVDIAFIHVDRIMPSVFGLAIIFGVLFYMVRKDKLKNIRYFWLSAVAVAALFMILRLPSFYTNLNVSNRVSSLAANVEKVSSHTKTSLVEIKQDRPINFVEQPVSPNDPWTIRAGTSMCALFHYFVKAIVPYPLSFYYGYKFIEPERITDPVPMLSIAIYLSLVGMSLYFFKHYKIIGFGIGIYLISIVGFSNYFLSVPGIVADRFLLTASLGWIIVLTAGVFKIFKTDIEKNKLKLTGLPMKAKYSFGILLASYALITISRNFDWKDYVSLMRHDINYVQNSAQAHNLLALNLMKRSYEIQDPAVQTADRTEALGHFKRATEISPGFYNATYDIGRVYSVLGQPDSSVSYFKKALAIDSSNSNPALFIGETLSNQGKFVESIPYLQFVIRKRPSDYESYDKLSYAYFKLGDPQNSIAVNRAAVVAIPGRSASYANIARVYITLNEKDSARSYLQKAVALSPNDQGIKSMLMQVESH